MVTLALRECPGRCGVVGAHRLPPGDGPRAPQLVEVAVGVGAGWEAPGVAADEIAGSLDLDTTMAVCPDHDLVAHGQASLTQDANRDCHLMFAGELTHRLYGSAKS